MRITRGVCLYVICICIYLFSKKVIWWNYYFNSFQAQEDEKQQTSRREFNVMMDHRTATTEDQIKTITSLRWPEDLQDLESSPPRTIKYTIGITFHLRQSRLDIRGKSAYLAKRSTSLSTKRSTGSPKPVSFAWSLPVCGYLVGYRACKCHYVNIQGVPEKNAQSLP